MNAIQFIGTQRSGSNLLRVMLNQLPRISAPHPPHVLKTFFPLLPLYGDLDNATNFRQLVSDVCGWVNGNPVPWAGIHFDTEVVEARCARNSLIDIFVVLHEMKAVVDQADFWCCKSMESVNYLPEIEASGLHPFYIYLFRDGRDVALSFKKAIVGPKHIYHLASKWREEQRLSLNMIQTLPPERFISIRYEEFIAKPGDTVKLICEKLHIDFSEEVFHYFESTESHNTAESGEMWQNLTKPVMDSNFNKFKKEMSTDDIALFEKVAGDVLLELGYELCSSQHQSSVFTTEQIAEFDRIDKQMRDEAVKRAPAVDKEKRQQQENLLKEIKSRNRVSV